MLRIAILASTNATDMQAIIDAIKSRKLSVEISIVLSNKKEAYALERAKNSNIPALFLDTKGKEREEYDKGLSRTIDKYKVGIIVLIGYMKYLSKWFVERYKNKIVNIHPSLLPAFAGGTDKNVHERVLERGCKITGCTLHFVDEGEDTGPIIMQKAINIEDSETADSLKEKVQKAEQEILVKALDLFSKGRIMVQGKKVKILK